jgi:hypothetical protein
MTQAPEDETSRPAEGNGKCVTSAADNDVGVDGEST